MERLVERTPDGTLYLTKEFPSANDALDVLAERLELFEEIIFSDEATLRIPLEDLNRLIRGAEQAAKQQKAKKALSELYFLIIGAAINYPMGGCTGEGVMDVLDEELTARLLPVSKEQFDAYVDFGHLPYQVGSFDWMAHALSRDEVERLLSEKTILARENDISLKGD